ncbi:MAG: Ni-sirohydrochlorin a,c-diamide reductive cyclase catalytic subunit [Methanobrevibacter sp.]|jgi:putative methanogenesis marker 13 metalloprotein|nr:Ni-sirohydrochlorin a,c-diamide reductive cyclase catalytic subunit [Methanobrevibacter sp.]
MHPRPSPIAASLYTLRDLNADVVIIHGPHGCCFRTGRLLEGDGVRVLTTAMAEKDFVFGAGEKLKNVLKKAEKMFNPKLIGVVGTCASMIIGENMKDIIKEANINAIVLPVESHGGLKDGDNTNGAIAVLESAVEYGIIDEKESSRQTKMLKLATKIEKTRGMAQGEYIKPSFGDNKEKIAKIIVEAIKNNEKVGFLLNSKKETSYLFADILNFNYKKINPNNKPIIVANLNNNIGFPRIKTHAKYILNQLKNNGIEVDYITGGLDEYPITADVAEQYLKDKNIDLLIVAGVPHALKIENLNLKSIAVTDGPRIVEPLKNLGYDYVVAELDAHSKTLGINSITRSDFGTMIRSTIDWVNEENN